MHFNENGNNLIFELKCDTHLMAWNTLLPSHPMLTNFVPNSCNLNPPKSNKAFTIRLNTPLMSLKTLTILTQKRWGSSSKLGPHIIGLTTIECFQLL